MTPLYLITYCNGSGSVYEPMYITVNWRVYAGQDAEDCGRLDLMTGDTQWSMWPDTLGYLKPIDALIVAANEE